MNNVMIDIETLSTSKNAVIISLGAVFFDIETGKLGSSFYYTINCASCEAYGLETDASTINWWREQTEEARAVLTCPDADALPQVLHDFAGWLGENTPEDQHPEIWGNGPSFDNAILDNAYRACGIKTPWRYSNERCVRTMVNLGRQLLNIDPKKTIERVGTHHHALADAEHQAKYVSAIYQALNFCRTESFAHDFRSSIALHVISRLPVADDEQIESELAFLEDLLSACTISTSDIRVKNALKYTAERQEYYFNDTEASQKITRQNLTYIDEALKAKVGAA